MSILDLFASAMGAFLIIMIILLPYYLKAGDAEKLVVKLRAENAQLTQLLKQTQQQLEHANQYKRQLASLQGELENCHEKLEHTFLAVVLKWATSKQDVDLHVVDTDGNEFYFSKHNRSRSDFPSSNAELSVDTIKGPGIEIWEIPLAKTGIYKIYANLYSRHGNTSNPLVKTNLYYRDGALPLRDVTLTTEGNKVLIAIVEVKIGGEVVVRR